MVIRRILLGMLAITAVVATGCTSDDEPLPDAATLLSESATAASEIKSTHFTLQVNGSVEGLNIQRLEGDLTKEGLAKGTGTMRQFGQLVEAEFVLTEDTLYLKGPTGGYQELPASMVSSVYDPAAVLDPERGMAKLIESVREPATEAEEDVDGTAAYRVTGKVTGDVLAELVPGVSSDADVTLWLAKDGGHLPIKASASLGGDTSVDITLSDVDKPVDVTPPA